MQNKHALKNKKVSKCIKMINIESALTDMNGSKCITMIQCTKLCKNENMHRNHKFHKNDTLMHQSEMLKMHKEYDCMTYNNRSIIKMH